MRAAQFICVALPLIAAILLASPPAKTPTRSPQASSYLGLDLNDYPGDDALPILRKTFLFTGYWLGPPPGEKRTSWLGKRALLRVRGFGFIVLYNGRLTKNLKSNSDAQQKGARDAESAAALARREGFPAGTIIFLDIEEGGRLSPAYHEYVHAWIDGLTRARFRSGAYCSGIPLPDEPGKTISTAEDLQQHLGERKLAVWIFNDVCPPSPGCVFPKSPPSVAQGGFAGAALWQYAQTPRQKQRTAQCAATYNADGNCYAPGDANHKWFLDADVATSADPSAP